MGLPCVYLKKTKNRKRFVKRVFEKTEIRKEIGEAKKILLKPNIVSFEPYPTTTHPDLLRVCLEILLGFKKEVLVADGPAHDAGDSEKIIREHPLKKVCDKLGVQLIDLNHQPFKKVRTKSFDLEISAIPFKYDYIISLPVLKSHGECGITGALKNQYGLLSPRDKLKLHGMNIHQAIAELNLAVRPNFWIIDAIQTLIETNEVRHGGKLKGLGFMLAGKDPVSLDIEGLNLLKKVDLDLKNKNPEDILHLKYAIDLGVGESEYEIKTF